MDVSDSSLTCFESTLHDFNDISLLNSSIDSEFNVELAESNLISMLCTCKNSNLSWSFLHNAINGKQDHFV